MRIDKETFNKLPQLDRIEYRQRVSIIDDIIYTINPLNYLMLFTFLFVLDIWFGLRTGDWLIKMSTYILVFEITILLVLIEMFVKLILIAVRFRDRNKLEKEYFKIINIKRRK